MKDDRVRTVRIDQKYRAVVLHPESGDVHVLVWVDNHDEAMDWARNKHTYVLMTPNWDISVYWECAAPGVNVGWAWRSCSMLSVSSSAGASAKPAWVWTRRT